MENYSNNDLVSAYLKEWIEGGAQSWANDAVDDLVQRDPERAWLVLLDLISQAPSDIILDIIAAGPVENLLCKHGHKFIDRFEEESRRNGKLRDAAHIVRGKNQMAPDVWDRLEQLRKLDHG